MKRLPNRQLLLLFCAAFCVIIVLLLKSVHPHTGESLLKPEYSMPLKINRPIVAIRKEWLNNNPDMVYERDDQDSIIYPGYRLLSGSEKIKQVSTIIKTDNDYCWYRLPPSYSSFHLYFVEYGRAIDGSTQKDSIITARYWAAVEPYLSLKRFFVKHTTALPDTAFFCGNTTETPHYCLYNNSLFLTPSQCFNNGYQYDHYPILEIRDYAIDTSVNFNVSDTNGISFFRNHKISLSEFSLMLVLADNHLYTGSLVPNAK